MYNTLGLHFIILDSWYWAAFVSQAGSKDSERSGVSQHSTVNFRQLTPLSFSVVQTDNTYWAPPVH